MTYVNMTAYFTHERKKVEVIVPTVTGLVKYGLQSGCIRVPSIPAVSSSVLAVAN
jgi:hypothetical protein